MCFRVVYPSVWVVEIQPFQPFSHGRPKIVRKGGRTDLRKHSLSNVRVITAWTHFQRWERRECLESLEFKEVLSS